MKSPFLRIVLPVIILAGGGLLTAVLLKSSPKPERHSQERAPVAVEVVVAQPVTTAALVHATGVVTPAQKINLSAEVSGRVIALADDMLPGGRFARGKMIARLDPRDYQLVIRQQESAVEQAELALQLELSRAGIAAREWALLGAGKDSKKAGLALRKPQLAAAERAVEAAKSVLERAQLSLERATLRAPFNSMVLTKSIDLGQIVNPGQSLATLVGTDRFWVRVSVAVDKLNLIDIPGVNAEQGSRVTLLQRVGLGQVAERHGEVLRLQGELDPQTRTAQLLVSVDDPLESGDRPPLLPGAFVDVRIEGRGQSGGTPVPRSALIDDHYVWLVDPQSRLRRREVQVGWRSRDEVYLSAGLAAGDRVVHSPLALPIDGLEVAITSSAATLVKRAPSSQPSAVNEAGAQP